jgi:kynureninase
MSVSKMDFDVSEEYALRLDAEDPLASFNDRFYQIPGVIYMDGNSLGLLSKAAEATLLRVLDEWKRLGVKGWSQGKIPWIWYGEQLGALMAPLMGAEPEEVVVTGSTTVNLHTLVATFYRPDRQRSKILADELNFPSDIYALAAQVRLKGGDSDDGLLLVRSKNGRTIDEDDIIDAMTDEVVLALFPSVYYRSGQLLDMRRLTEEAHKRNIIIGFDCSHSVGVVPHRFDEWGVDFAIWCNYKYMDGGPGGTAGVYVNKRHFGVWPGLAGWWGHDKATQFNMDITFTPARSAGAWQIGTVSMLGSAPLEGSARLMLEAGIENVRRKSLTMTDYLMFLVDELLSDSPYSFLVRTPREHQRRGGHVAVEHPTEAFRIVEALKSRGVIPDFRQPNVVRLAPVPLYTSYHDVWMVVQHLKAIIDNREYEKFSKERGIVT